MLAIRTNRVCGSSSQLGLTVLTFQLSVRSYSIGRSTSQLGLIQLSVRSYSIGRSSSQLGLTVRSYSIDVPALS